jgi:hypothetical protein
VLDVVPVERTGEITCDISMFLVKQERGLVTPEWEWRFIA